MPLMEDVDIVRRIGARRLSILRSRAVTSGGKYRRDGYIWRSSRNLLLLARDTDSALAVAEAAVAAMKALPNVVMPFPGGVVRSGSKVGSKYAALNASTNDAFCPSLVGLVAHSELTAETRCVMEIVIDGLTEKDVADAMRAGMQAGVTIGAAGGLLRISAGNYGGKLGPFHFHLHKLMGPGA